MNMREIYEPLKRLAKEWGCICYFKKVKTIGHGGHNIVGYFDDTRTPRVIKILYTDKTSVHDLRHIFFHELSHRLWELYHFLIPSVVKRISSLTLENEVEKQTYYLYKTYYPNDCPHHSAFAIYRRVTNTSIKENNFLALTVDEQIKKGVING